MASHEPRNIEISKLNSPNETNKDTVLRNLRTAKMNSNCTAAIT